MRRKKSLVLRLLPWVIVLAALAALVWFVFVPIYSQKEDSFGRPQEVVSSEGISGKLTMENDALLFEMDQATTQFTVKTKNQTRCGIPTPKNGTAIPLPWGPTRKHFPPP